MAILFDLTVREVAKEMAEDVLFFSAVQHEIQFGVGNLEVE